MTGNAYLLAEYVSLGLPVQSRCDEVTYSDPSQLCTCLLHHINYITAHRDVSCNLVICACKSSFSAQLDGCSNNAVCCSDECFELLWHFAHVFVHGKLLVMLGGSVNRMHVLERAQHECDGTCLLHVFPIHMYL